MANPNSSFYEEKARVVSVLANAKRLEIIDLLAEGEKTVTEIAETIGLAQAGTSQHLAAMRKVGILETKKRGNFVFYHLADPKIASACSVMSRAVLELLVRQQKKIKPVLAIARKMQ